LIILFVTIPVGFYLLVQILNMISRAPETVKMDKIELEEKVLFNVKEQVVPYIEKLKKAGLDKRQMTCVSIVESNLNSIISPFSTSSFNTFSSYPGSTNSKKPANVSPTRKRARNKTGKTIFLYIFHPTRKYRVLDSGLTQKLSTISPIRVKFKSIICAGNRWAEIVSC